MKDQQLFSAKRYPDDIRSRAVAAVETRRLENPLDRTVFREVAEEFGIGEQSLRLWVKRLASDSRKSRPSDMSSKLTEIRDARITPAQLEAEVMNLRKKVEKLQAENDVLKRAFVVFSSEWEK